ncbi:isochorismate synthase [Tsukamurella asaccharolytica]|uniref:Isochorismate synthase n=1 Tax=Tsukamurella asaccharolytica TaxID=2592067 RepID=A0A5C5RDM5_9ACTN|nr:chorismate-binding protein [Tsukamurella asaccharolytica]TWS21169.1 isochorismate synthase [Tsukamurella asaccharolytica]
MTTTGGESDQPHFLLTAAGQRLAARGTAGTFTDPHAAAAALRAGTAPVVVGALPFDLAEPAALTVPEHFGEVPATALAAAGESPTLTQTAQHPAPSEHVDRVRRALALIESSELRKVVLARAVDFEAAAPLDPLAVAVALERRDLEGNAFAVDLAAAGDAHRGRWIVGSSPEILVGRMGGTVFCHPFAGTATSPEGLLDSEKDREEHAYVVDEIAAALAPLCSELDVPAAPSVTRAGPVWHLGTKVEGRLADLTTSALDLALALHPTPAVCGFPRRIAARAIADIEGERGFYAGAVGWTAANGDGHWRVSIRCAELDGARLRAYAGGGIVGASDPRAELAETRNKLRTVLGPFRFAGSCDPTQVTRS